MEIRVLGPLEVWASGADVPLGGLRARTVLALLALDADRVVPVARLVDAIWGETPPATAVGQVHTIVWRLRRLLGDVLESRPSGYCLHVPAGTVDIQTFEHLVSDASAAAAEQRFEAASRAYGAALALWRGEPLSNVPSLTTEASLLEERRLAAAEGRAEAELALGANEALVVELTGLVARYPLRERLHAQLMTALHRCGRTVEALSVYRKLRERLVDEFGLEPGPELGELQQRILAREPLTPPHIEPRPTGYVGPPDPSGEIPQTRYVGANGVHIAFQVLGDGEPDIVLVPGLLSHLDLWWADRATARFMRRLAALGRLIVFDKRGTGLSDRPDEAQTLDDRMDDIRMVMDAAGSRRAVLVGYSEGGPMSLLFAAGHPERVSALVLTGASARWSAADDYPCGKGSGNMFEALEAIGEDEWGRGNTIEWYVPSLAGSERARALVARRERMSVSPNDYLRMLRMVREIDVRPILGSVRVPVLVFQRTDDRVTPPCHGRYLAAHLPHCEYIEQPGDHAIWIGQTEAFLGAVKSMIHQRRTPTSPGEALVALLSVQVVQPPLRPMSLDRLVGAFEDSSGLPSGGSRLVQTCRERLLATFDGPVRAIEAAMRIRVEAGLVGEAVRCGVHVGTAGRADGVPTPTSQELVETLSGFADSGDVLATRTVRDLVVGSPFEFTPYPHAELHSEPEPLPVYAVRQCPR